MITMWTRADTRVSLGERESEVWNVVVYFCWLKKKKNNVRCNIDETEIKIILASRQKYNYK